MKSVVKVPPNVPLEEAAAIDPASIALHTARRGNIAPGDTVVVLGSGSMGLFVQQCALHLGAGRVIVAGSGARLEHARRLGAETIDYRREDSVARVHEMTGGCGPEVVLECAGTETAVQQAVEMVARGGTISMIGIPGHDAALNIKKIVLEEIDLRGCRANRGTVEEVVPWLASGRLDVRSLITHRYPLVAFDRALRAFTGREGGAVKVLIQPGQEAVAREEVES
ncbi:MAG TPA: hypothetical protein DEP84_03020 [Chloroflexi bacterium]|nr:hypothetical protein [Chloroflexota bacterium]